MNIAIMLKNILASYTWETFSLVTYFMLFV